MYIRHHPHCSVESVTERGATAPSLSSVCGRGHQVVDSRNLSSERVPRVYSGHRGSGSPSRWSEDDQRDSTAQHILYNIKRTVLKLVSSCENDSPVLDLEFRLFLPRPREKNPQPTPKHLPIKFPIKFPITIALTQG
jgi:hypothetical protein